MEGLLHCFADLENPRIGNAGRHDLLEILMIALCTVLSDGQTAVDMALFAREQEVFVRRFLVREHGVPSQDTLSRMFRLQDAEPFGARFPHFMARFSEICQGVVAIDGKVLRRSFDKAGGTSALHMVSASGCEQQLVLGQVATDTKSNQQFSFWLFRVISSYARAVVSDSRWGWMCSTALYRNCVRSARLCRTSGREAISAMRWPTSGFRRSLFASCRARRSWPISVHFRARGGVRTARRCSPCRGSRRTTRSARCWIR